MLQNFQFRVNLKKFSSNMKADFSQWRNVSFAKKMPKLRKWVISNAESFSPRWDSNRVCGSDMSQIL